jgi:hypothetical protein
MDERDTSRIAANAPTRRQRFVVIKIDASLARMPNIHGVEDSVVPAGGLARQWIPIAKT